MTKLIGLGSAFMRPAALAAAISLSIIGIACADPASAALRKSTDIPAQALDQALNSIATDFEFQVLYRTDIVKPLSTAGVSGYVTAAEALDRVLSGTGLTYRYIDEKTVSIVPVASEQGAAASPNGSTPEGGADTSEGSKRTANNTSSGFFRLAQATAGSTEGPVSGEPASEGGRLEEIVVTGSRIRREISAADRPIVSLGAEEIAAKGQINVADALNELPISGLQESGRGDQGANVGRNYANLFNLGSQRTLTLVNGRRFVSSNPGAPDTRSPGSQVDLNVLPAGLIDRVEIVEGTGSATYGSGAIAGVVNVILKKKFEGVQLDAQASVTGEGDRKVRLGRFTGGQTFADGRASFIFTGEYSRSDGLFIADRASLAQGYSFARNAANVNRTDGIPASILISDTTVPEITTGGLPFRANSFQLSDIITMPDPSNPAARVPAQFAPDGTLVPYNPGTFYGATVASGGDGLALANTFQLLSPVERSLAYAIGSYDLTDGVRLSTELSLARVEASELMDQGTAFNSALFGGAMGSIPVSTSNPFLGSQARTLIESQGITNFYLSRYSSDILEAGGGATVRNDTMRGVLALDGDFEALDRSFYWNANLNWGRTKGRSISHDFIQQNFLNAIDAVQSGGSIVCRSAAPGCQPLDLFGRGRPSAEAIAYVIGEFRRDGELTQFAPQLNLDGDVVTLPTGKVKFSIGYEYRKEESDFTPDAASIAAIGRNSPVVPISGSYHSSEGYGEISVPLIGEDFQLPGMQSLQLDAAGRIVDHSFAGRDESWNYGLNWVVIPDVSLHASRSKTFRAPSAIELFLPTVTGSSGITLDPCDARNIAAGINPTARTANCRALFQSLGLPADYQLTSNIQNTSVPVTVGGNASLTNEFARSDAFGIVLRPRFVPDLTLSADWLQMKLMDGIVNFRTSAILSTCFDAPNPSRAVCELVTRNSAAQITGAKTGFVNAASTRFKGATYSLDYRLPLARVGLPNAGAVRFAVDVVNIRELTASVSGLGYDADPAAGEVGTPRWKGQARFVYERDPFTFAWITNYVSSSVYNLTLTNEDRDVLGFPHYVKSDVSLQWQATQQVTARFGVNNVFDKLVPWPGGANGADFGSYDVIGRNFFLSLNARF